MRKIGSSKMRVLGALVGQIFALDILLSESQGSDYCSNITTFTTDLDHFSFDDRKTDIRVITDDRFYQPGGPVLFYTGNEGSVTKSFRKQFSTSINDNQ